MMAPRYRRCAKRMVLFKEFDMLGFVMLDKAISVGRAVYQSLNSFMKLSRLKSVISLKSPNLYRMLALMTPILARFI